MSAPGETSVRDDVPLADTPVILIPVFNDWTALRALLQALDRSLADARRPARVLVLDDGSTETIPRNTADGPFEALREVRVLELRRNLGHQRALAVGLAYVDSAVETPTVVVMDGDGEDDPADVPRLLDRYDAEGGRVIVFAERRKRSESLSFRVFYALYRVLHVVLTGRRVRVGNFSVMPRQQLHRLAVVSELWNHYAAAVFKARLPYVTVPTSRAKRLDGKSTMNTVSLVVHGLSAISVYSEIVGVRALATSVVLIVISTMGIAVVAGIRFFTNLAIPGWATASSGLLFLILLQAVLFSMIFSFTTLANRHGFSFLPARDYSYFVGRIVDVYRPGL